MKQKYETKKKKDESYKKDQKNKLSNLIQNQD